MPYGSVSNFLGGIGNWLRQRRQQQGIQTAQPMVDPRKAGGPDPGAIKQMRAARGDFATQLRIPSPVQPTVQGTTQAMVQQQTQQEQPTMASVMASRQQALQASLKRKRSGLAQAAMSGPMNRFNE